MTTCSCAADWRLLSIEELAAISAAVTRPGEYSDWTRKSVGPHVPSNRRPSGSFSAPLDGVCPPRNRRPRRFFSIDWTTTRKRSLAAGKIISNGAFIRERVTRRPARCPARPTPAVPQLASVYTDGNRDLLLPRPSRQLRREGLLIDRRPYR